MQFDQIINATGRPLAICDGDGATRVVEPSHVVARAHERVVTLSDAALNGMAMPVHGIAYHITGLPESRAGVHYVVSWRVARAAPDRSDLLVPGPVVRDEHDRAFGLRGLAVPHHPAARRAVPRLFSTRAELEDLLLSELEDLAGASRAPEHLIHLAFERGLMCEEEADLALAHFTEGSELRGSAHCRSASPVASLGDEKGGEEMTDPHDETLQPRGARRVEPDAPASVRC